MLNKLINELYAFRNYINENDNSDSEYGLLDEAKRVIKSMESILSQGTDPRYCCKHCGNIYLPGCLSEAEDAKAAQDIGWNTETPLCPRCHAAEKIANTGPISITDRMLVNAGTPQQYRDKFAKVFGFKMDLTQENVKKAISAGMSEVLQWIVQDTDIVSLDDKRFDWDHYRATADSIFDLRISLRDSLHSAFIDGFITEECAMKQAENMRELMAIFEACRIGACVR